MSFYKWNVFRPPEFLGTENYTRLFSDETVSRQLSEHAAICGDGGDPANHPCPAVGDWGAAKDGHPSLLLPRLSLPLLMSGAVSITLGYMFHKEFDRSITIWGWWASPCVSWLTSRNGHGHGGDRRSGKTFGFTFILFVGGLSKYFRQSCSTQLMSTAQGWRRQLWHIILPMLSPTLLFAVVVARIGALQVFEQPYIMTCGGPGNATRPAVMVMYEAASKNVEIGYGSSITVILFILIMAVTMFQFWLSRRWVFYQ
ncbi:MAG: sugar ABC transporter permease [Caldilineaceae bacterium]